jgi:hypothetical protein
MMIKRLLGGKGSVSESWSVRTLTPVELCIGYLLMFCFRVILFPFISSLLCFSSCVFFLGGLVFLLSCVSCFRPHSLMGVFT